MKTDKIKIVALLVTCTTIFNMWDNPTSGLPHEELNVNNNVDCVELYNPLQRTHKGLRVSDTREDILIDKKVLEDTKKIDFKAYFKISPKGKYKSPWNTEVNSLSNQSRDSSEIYVPLFLQTDKRWGHLKIGNTNLSDGGCGIVSLCMVSSALGNLQLPSDVVSKFEKYYLNNTGLYWSAMTDGAKEVLGLDAKQLHNLKPDIVQKEMTGKIGIVSFKPGKFTSSGHFAVVVLDETQEKFKLYDPNDSAKKLFKYKEWDIEYILSQTKGMWVYK